MAKVQILVVEDENIIAMEIEERLKQLGYAVAAVVSTGEEAVEKATEVHPDLILMDIMLGGEVDGIAAAEQIKARLSVPVVYLTAYGDDKTLKRAKITEPFGYVLKPFEEGELQVAIELALYKHQTEKALQRAHDELEIRVEQRTAELAKANEQLKLELAERHKVEANLRVAKQAAEASDKAKSEFLSTMSHELRTPMNAIIGFSEVLSDEIFGELNAKQKRYVGNILESGKHLLQLINDILDLSKVEAGRMELKLSEFDLTTAVHDVENIVKVLVNRKRIALSIDVETDPDGSGQALPPITADEPKFKQILYNLLSNAIKYTPDGGRVTVTAKQIPFDSPPVNRASETLLKGEGSGVPPLEEEVKGVSTSAIEIAIADTGIGIKKEDQQQIFAVFEQLDQSYARQQEGTGLGLTLTQKLIELHNGKIWVESEGEGKGSTFTFVIPLVAKPSDGWTEAAEATAPSATALDAKKPLILVVEDDSKARELLTTYLDEVGYAVAHAFDGVQGIEMAPKLKPAAILLDILLPKKGGLDVLAELKSTPETQDIPVVVVSVTEDQQLGFSLGAVEWFVKPVDKAQLIAALHRAGATADAEAMAVLVVDDQPQVVELLTDILQSEGHAVLQAYGGRQGISLALAKRPNLIILDLMMPEVTGFDVVEQLRACPETREIPIMIYTAKDITDADIQQLNSKVQALTKKPLSKADFLRELEQVGKMKRNA
jgi:signal transduction histidine kinase